MNSKAGSVYAFLDARTPMANSDQLPVKLSCFLKGSQFRIGLKLRATPELFQKAMSPKGSIPKDAKMLKAEIDVYLDKAKAILDEFPNANQKLFTNLFKSDTGLKVSGKTDMRVLFQSKIDELIDEDRAGSVSFYQQSLNVFVRFRNDFYLEDVTVPWLKAFRAWWINQGNSNATAQIHMRSLRHIYNLAIKNGSIAQGHYPFKEYSIGSSTKSKDVVYPAQMKKLWKYKPRTNGEARSKDFFIFLYIQNGLNLKDALSIKGSQIKGDMISFVRAKTSKTASETKEIMMYLHPEAKRIIEKWGDLDTQDYLFPWFRGTESDMERKHAKDILARNLNRDLRPIGKALKLPTNLTLNLARHSYATKLKLDGVPVSFISDALGHSSAAVTAHYMKGLPDAHYKKISESLLNFK